MSVVLLQTILPLLLRHTHQSQGDNNARISASDLPAFVTFWAEILKFLFVLVLLLSASQKSKRVTHATGGIKATFAETAGCFISALQQHRYVE